jgi:two-component system, chemotaxis family, chemotaxis protein CheY
MVDLSMMRVLVVDDNDFMRDLVSSMLREIGFREIHHARDGEDALRQTTSVDPTLIICDVDMEPMDGLTFVEQLRKTTPHDGVQIPVILLTAHSEAQIVQRALKLGVNGYVVKPVKKNQLEARVMTALERRSGG